MLAVIDTNILVSALWSKERFSCKSVELGAQRKGYPLYR